MSGATKRWFVYEDVQRGFGYGKILTSYRTEEEIPLAQLKCAIYQSSFIVLYQEWDTLRTVYQDTDKAIQQAIERAKEIRIEYPTSNSRVECTPNLSYWGHEIRELIGLQGVY